MVCEMQTVFSPGKAMPILASAPGGRVTSNQQSPSCIKIKAKEQAALLSDTLNEEIVKALNRKPYAKIDIRNREALSQRNVRG